jgi:hypothetical protein
MWTLLVNKIPVMAFSSMESGWEKLAWCGLSILYPGETLGMMPVPYPSLSFIGLINRGKAGGSGLQVAMAFSWTQMPLCSLLHLFLLYLYLHKVMLIIHVQWDIRFLYNLFWLKKILNKLGMVAHACDPSYGRHR